MNQDNEHSFKKSLAESHRIESLPFWERVYREKFPTFKEMRIHRYDQGRQALGVDRSIILLNGERILIDEKVRGRNKITGKVYKDIALEYMSDVERELFGWACKPMKSDFIAYAIAPMGLCYFLPVGSMQAAYKSNEEKWKQFYPKIESKNREGDHRWTTLSLAIPVVILSATIGQELIPVQFDPFDFADNVSAVESQKTCIHQPINATFQNGVPGIGKIESFVYCGKCTQILDKNPAVSKPIIERIVDKVFAIFGSQELPEILPAPAETYPMEMWDWYAKNQIKNCQVCGHIMHMHSSKEIWICFERRG